jgi:outer membrane protein OmpA-like peptidoglycan-associated protein
MNLRGCLGFILCLVAAACEPPAKVTSPTSASSAPVESSAKPIATVSAAPTAEAVASATAPIVSASSPTPLPCPPEVPRPAGALAWLSGCAILLGDPIYFEFDKEHIKKQSYPVLDAVGDVLTQNPELHVEVQAHLGEPQNPPYGRSLSRDRARSVMKYLIVKKGVAPERITAQGYGVDKPIADWKTEEGRKKNRRIEFIIMNRGGGGK